MTIAERIAREREHAFLVLECLFPYVRGNPFIPHWPTRMQFQLLGAHLWPAAQKQRVFEALYGGAAGGGKSDALLMAVAQYAWQHPEFSAVCFRRTHQDLINPGALLDRAIEWWTPAGVSWSGSTSIFTFPSGAKVKMGHMSQPDAHLDHQGAEYHLSVWDELTQHPTSKQYEYVGLSRVRRREGCSIPLRTLAASNPGGPGHRWVKNRFVGGIDPLTKKFVRPAHPYIPARITDNPHLDQGSYIESLKMLHPTLREQLLSGDWEAREPGDYFRAEWFGPFLDPERDLWPAADCIRIRWWDLAASEKADAARTAGVKMARHRAGVRALEHAIAFQATPGKRDDRIAQVAKMDGPTVYVGLEIEPGSGGVAQFESLQKRLKAQGFKVVGARPRVELANAAEAKLLSRNLTGEKGKMGRADPVAACLERGYQRRGECPDTGGPWWGLDAERPVTQQQDGLRIFAGAWNQDYLDEVEGFPEDAVRMDYVDATSGAWAWTEAHPFGLAVPPTERVRSKIDSRDIHPEDREDRAKPERYTP